MRGSSSRAVLFIRDAIKQMLGEQAKRWTLAISDTRFSAWDTLAAAQDTGIIIVLYAGDRTLSQSFRSLVTAASISIVVAGRKHISPDASLKASKNEGDLRLLEMHDRIKGLMMSITLPNGIIPEEVAKVPSYQNSTNFTAPDGIPLDSLEQTWEFELVEEFTPENTP